MHDREFASDAPVPAAALDPNVYLVGRQVAGYGGF